MVVPGNRANFPSSTSYLHSTQHIQYIHFYCRHARRSLSGKLDISTTILSPRFNSTASMVSEQINRSLSVSAIHYPGDRVSSVSASRPASSSTTPSIFADSAVDIETPIPTDIKHQPNAERFIDYFESTLPLPSPDVDQTLSDKMRQLAAVAWTLEQDESMSATKRNQIKRMLLELETQLDSEDVDAPDSAPTKEVSDLKDNYDDTRNLGSAEVVARGFDAEEEWIDESELIAVRDDLVATVKSMQLRYEEQMHLHALTANKLEAIAQRCVAQEQQVQNLLKELRALRDETHALNIENNRLRTKVSGLELEASRSEVAVHAMSSAVTGLEGWIDSTSPSRDPTPTPANRLRRQKVVIRGKGRFRGRYYVDEDEDDDDEADWYSQALVESELHQGVKAWLRGFHDVEEELRQQDSSSRRHSQEMYSTPETQDGVDWGDFQAVENA